MPFWGTWNQANPQLFGGKTFTVIVFILMYCVLKGTSLSVWVLGI
jgi:hypothetical protein